MCVHEQDTLQGNYTQITKKLFLTSIITVPRSFVFICSGYEISNTEVSASTQVQWKWVEFHLWRSKHWEITFEKFSNNASPEIISVHHVLNHTKNSVSKIFIKTFCNKKKKVNMKTGGIFSK